MSKYPESKISYPALKEEIRTIGRKMTGTNEDYDDQLFDQLYEDFVQWLQVGDYLEAKSNGLDMMNDCPNCRSPLDVMSYYQKLSEENKRLVLRFLRFLKLDT